MQRIRELRKKKNIHAWQLGKNIGVSESTILGYEKSHHLPDINKLILIADYFNVSIDYIVGRVDNNFNYLNSYEIAALSSNYKALLHRNNQLLEIIIKIKELEEKK